MKRTELALLGFFLFVCLFSEPLKKGFELSGHRGWVASHSSAQAIHATSETGFVGYAYKTQSETGANYLYFDRYPFFFAALTSFTLSPFSNDLENWVVASKVLMNLIYFLTGFLIYLIAGFFLRNKWQQLSVALLSMSGEYFVTYRSMFHFDQPAIFCQAFLIYSILCLEFSRNKRIFYFAAFTTPLLGRGYVSLFTMLLYFIMRFILPGLQKRKEIFFLSLKSLLPSALLCSSFLAYNIYSEARIRNVDIDEVSIVMSAKSRLGLVKHADIKLEKNLSLGSFLSTQSSRFSRHVTPFSIGRSFGIFLTLALIILFAFITFRSFKKGDRNLVFLFGFLILTGPFWTFPLKRLTHFHDYTTMYYWATGMALYISLFRWLPERKWISYVVVVVFLSSLGAWWKKSSKSVDEINALASEFSKVREILNTYPNISLAVDPGISNFLQQRPYILGFYFHDRFLTVSGQQSPLLLSSRTLSMEPIFEGKKLNLYLRKQ